MTQEAVDRADRRIRDAVQRDHKDIRAVLRNLNAPRHAQSSHLRIARFLATRRPALFPHLKTLWQEYWAAVVAAAEAREAFASDDDP